MNPVGISTSNLYESNLSLMERAKLALSLGATAVELGVPKLADFPISEETAEILRRFDYVSMHISFKENGETFSDGIIHRLKDICESAPINGIVIHPDLLTAGELSKMDTSGLPFLIENMDIRKKTGTHPEHIAKIRDNYEFGFVFDTQHAWEHDPGLSWARELLDAMGDRLAHMHVSGNAEEHKHWPTYMADNREKISEMLKWKIRVPKISEGKMAGNLKQIITSELKYIRIFETD